MKILLIVHNQKNSGPFPKIFEIAKKIALYNNDVTIFCTSRNNLFKKYISYDDGVRIIEFPDSLWGRLRQGYDPWNTLLRMIYIVKMRFDVIHAIDCRPVVIFPILTSKMFYKTPLVMSWWDLFSSSAIERNIKFYPSFFIRIEKYFDYNFRLKADFALPISEFLKNKLLRMNYPPDKTKVLKIGYDTIDKKYDKRQTRIELNLPSDKLIFSYVGTIFPNDFKLLYSSLKKVKDHFKINFITLLIGDYNFIGKDIKSDINMVITGRVEYQMVHQYLNASDISLLPFHLSDANMSRWPSKLGDYIISGNPIVATEVSDLKSIYSKYKIGFMSKNDSIEEYSNAILSCIKNRNEWIDIRRNSEKCLNEILSNKIIIQELISIYESVRN